MDGKTRKLMTIRSCIRELTSIDCSGSVATHLRCGGVFSDSVITNFLPILTVK